MGKCPQPVTDSSQTPDSSKPPDSVDITSKIGFSFRTIPVEDTGVNHRIMSVEDKPNKNTTTKPVTVGFTPPVVVVTTAFTKKPVKL